MSAFNWLINFVPVLGVLVGWVRKLFEVKVLAFLLLKGIVFFLFYKYLPLLFGRFYQWIYDTGVSSAGFDLAPFIDNLVLSMPAFSGLGAWFFLTLKLDVCLRIMVAGAVARLGIRRLPFMPS